MRTAGVIAGARRSSLADAWHPCVRPLLALCLVAGGLLVWSAHAAALSQRGHVLSLSFGESGAGVGQFSEPAGVAVHEVSESSDEVYVADRGNNRVERFTCTPLASKPACVYLAEVEVPSPEEIAVDNSSGPSSGDVYVVDKAKKNLIYKLRPVGEAGLEKLLVLKGPGAGEPFEAIHGVAVDADGGLWVDQAEAEGVPEEAVIDSFSGGEKNVFLFSRTAELCGPRAGFAADARAESFYVDHQSLNREAECIEEEAAEAPSVTAKLNSAGELVAQALEDEDSTAIAVDLASSGSSPLGAPARGDVYLDNVASVAAFTASGALIQRLALPGADPQSAGVALDSRTGALFALASKEDKLDVFAPQPPGPPTIDQLASQNITPTATGLSAQIDPDGATTSYVFEYATTPIAAGETCTGEPTSCTEAPVPPGTIPAGFGAVAVGARLMGLQPGTTYYYRVLATNTTEGFGKVTVESAGTANTFTTVPTAVGLLADHRAWEMVSPPDKNGAAIEAIPPEGGLIQASEDGDAITYLADAPITEEPQGNRSPERTQILSTRGREEWESQDIATPHESAEGVESGELFEYGFFSADLALSLVQPFGDTPRSEPPLAPQATEKTVYVRDDPPIAPEPAEQPTYRAAEEDRGFLSPGYLPLVSELNVPPGTKVAPKPAAGEQLQYVDATPDLNHVILLENSKTPDPLTRTPVGPGENYYEWTAGKPPEEPLQLVNVLPDGAAAPSSSIGAESGAKAGNLRGAISSDGARVFWSSQPGVLGTHLYMRDMSTRETIQVDAADAEQGVSEPESAEATFQEASSDGSRVFFTDMEPLTRESTAVANNIESEPTNADLYVCEVLETGGKPSCKLEDLSSKVANPGEAAGVQGLILGASEEGCDVGAEGECNVYFVATGVLAPGAAPGDCSEEPPPEAACNLYVEHFDSEPGVEKWEAPSFIARLSREDERDWDAPAAESGTRNLETLPVRVSPNGRFLAFMSQERLTGYDNTDQNSGEPDEEVYLYDASSHRLVCASCDPSGAPPVGVLDTRHTSEGVGLLVDRQELWAGHWLAGNIPAWAAGDEVRAVHQYRYLSDSGRLFFDSPVPLVPQDTNGKEDVYEYEPTGVGTCTGEPGCVSLISSGTSNRESAFLDASATGSNVFFLTAAQLLPQDVDHSFDVYDARECSEASPCLPPKPAPPPPLSGCETAQSCNTTSSSQPLFGPPATAFSSDAATIATQELVPLKITKPLPLTRAQRLAKALKACAKRPKKKRAACIKQAKRKYRRTNAKKSSRGRARTLR